MALNDFFVWGQGGRKITPEEAARERALSETILQRAGDVSPVGHWTQGAARVLDALGGVVRQRRAAAGEQQIAGVNRDLVSALLGTPSATPAASSAIPMTSAAGEVAATAPGSAIAAGGPEAYRNAIASIESAGSGDYSAIGPTNKNLGRALGRYQIMEANIGPWSREVLGREVTPEEFLANPSLQDAIFDAKFGQYVQQFGPEGAAQAWFAGPGGVGKVNRQDVLGTNVGEYGSKFLNALGASPETSPAASAIEAVAPTAQTGGLRPFQPGETRPNPDGSYSTEITTTWQLPDGSWVNVPSLWMGPNGPQQFSPDDEDNILGAMQQYEAQNGPTFQRFGSEQEAVSAAEARSSEGGAGAGPQLMADFSGSNQLSNAQGGIIPALTGGIPASPEQIARAQAAAQAPIEVAGGGDRVPMSPAGINPAIIEALTNPQATPQTQRLAAILLEQEQRKQQALAEQQAQAADPLRQLQIRKAQAEVDALGRPQIDGVTVGNRVIDRNTGRVIYEAPQADATFRQATPEEAQKFGAAAGQFGPDGRFYPINPPQGTSLSVDPATGAVTFNQGAGVKPLTEAQSKDTLYATRATNALPLVDKYENELLSLSGNLAEGIPLNLGNYAQSEQYQVARDAGRDFLATILRKDTGAAITANEENIYGKMFLPQPGDKPAALQAKRQRRALAVEAIKAGMPTTAIENMAKALEAVPPSTALEVPTDIPGVKIRRKAQ